MQYKDWLNEWLELYIKASRNERTYRKYRQLTEKYIMPVLGEYDVDELTPAMLQRFSLLLGCRALAANTESGVISVVKLSLKKAVSLGISDRQYSDAIVRPKARPSKVTCFCKVEQKKIERYVLANNTPYRFGIILCLYSGLRIGELLALTWDDIDFIKGTVTVTKSCHDSWQGGHYIKIIDPTKTPSSERTIPLPKQIIAYMRQIKRKTKSRFVVGGKSEYGAQVRSYQRTFCTILRNLGIEHKGFHALRHTFATRALEVGMDVKTLSEILGHKNSIVTLQHYAHSLNEHKAEMMNRVGRLLI